MSFAENAGDCGDSTNFRDLFSGHLNNIVNEGKHFAVSENGSYTEISRVSLNASYGVYMSSATTLSKVNIGIIYPLLNSIMFK